jgi:two-component system sensor histidine kinase UhpB
MNEKKAGPRRPCRVFVRSKSAIASDREIASLADEIVGVRLLSLQEDITQRIASDLHDSTCQHLIAASLSLLRLKRSANDVDTAEKICDEIDVSINQALREIRAYSYLLYPQDLLNDGLKRTIEEYVSGFAARTSLKTTVDITPEVGRLPYDTQCSLLRIVQEALTNVFRHANATKVKIAIEAMRNGLRLRVVDDGCGMPVRQTKSTPGATLLGIGIQGMRSRVRQLGGTFEIHASTGTRRGTTICAVLPYRLSREVPLPHPAHDRVGHLSPGARGQLTRFSSRN